MTPTIPSLVVEWIGRLGAPGALTVAALLLLAESALLVGVALPGISVPVALGLLAATGAVPSGAALAVAVGAAVTGPSAGFWLGRRPSALDRRPRHLPAAATRLVGLLRRRPRVAVAAGQWFAVSRTLVPRLAGSALSYPRFAAVSAPVAAAWSAAAFGLGHLLVGGSELAARVLSGQQWVATALLTALAALALATLVRAVRAARARRRTRRLTRARPAARPARAG